jgi:DNA-binding beta-propeller fold protein YncE
MGWRIALVGVAALLLAPAARAGGSPVALVTAETANEVLAVSLPDGKVLRRVRVYDPQAIAAQQSGPAVVVSPSGTVTLLAYPSLHVLRVFGGFRSPQIAAIAPDGEWAYVSDAATGYLTVIELAKREIVDRVFVGGGAHHLAVSPDGSRTWVALGETATTIVILNTSNPRAPRLIGRFRPRVAAHDLAFAPDGRSVWVSSASAPYVSVLNPHSGKLLARVPAGVGPQHVTFIPFGKLRAVITSGYGSMVETVNASTRRVVRRAAAPYGSFNVSAFGSFFATSSLLTGQVAEFTDTTLDRWMTRTVAPETRDLAVSVWP